MKATLLALLLVLLALGGVLYGLLRPGPEPLGDGVAASTATGRQEAALREEPTLRGAGQPAPARASEPDPKVRAPRPAAAKRARLTGRVLHPDGAPGAAVALGLERQEVVLNHLGAVSAHRVVSAGRATSDADGRFAFEDVRPESQHILRATPSRAFLVDVVTIEAGVLEMELRLRPSLRARLDVTDWRGVPVGGAFVEAKRSGDPRKHKTTTDPTGRAELDGLDPDGPLGAYVLEIKPASVNKDVGFPHRDAAWLPQDQAIQLERVFAVSGIVLDRGGRPVPRAKVWSVRDTGKPGEMTGWSVSADERGVFRAAPFREGPVELVAVVEGDLLGVWSLPRTTVAAGDEGVRLQVDAGAELEVRAEGWPADRSATAFLIRESNDPHTLMHHVRRSGVMRFRGLKRGSTYRLWVALDKHYVLREGIRAADSPLRVSVEAGGAVEGRIHAPEGAVLTHVELERTQLRKWGQVRAGESTFSVGGLPPGVWTVTAKANWGTKRGTATFEAHVGEVVDARPAWTWSER